jgi:hypothetical protein cdiviTM7_00321
MDIEIPLGKRTKKYRFFEMLPGMLSYGAIILLIILSMVNPVLASIYLLTVILVAFVKAMAISYRMISGRNNMERATRVDWSERLNDLENPKGAYTRLIDKQSKKLLYEQHLENLRLMAAAEEGYFPKPSNIYNALIMPAYNESIEVIEPALKSVLDTTYDKKHLIIIFAYEERGGVEIATTADTLKKKYGKYFHSFHLVKHPKDLPNEVIGKGGNITYAGKWLKKYLQQQNIAFSDVIVTTMDCDNKPHRYYFDYLTYEYITHEDRKHLSYQPICLFTNNIWDVPAPMRVVATGNSFWNIISSMRPYSLRNFASHSQPMDALVEMDFWSTRTIVEDGHQYWRSYFYFNGNYEVVPIFVPIYQDAVLSNGYTKTLRAQFVQLRRWSYGASDVAYVGNNIFNKKRTTKFWPSVARFIRLLDGHVTQACIALIVAFGGWAPLVLNSEAARSVAAHQLPDTVSLIQQVAMVGILISIFVSFKLLPPRPERYKRSRNILMVLQWLLMPVIAIVYSSMASYNAQTRLLIGKYLDKFDVTEKTTVEMNDQNRVQDKKKKVFRASSGGK